MVIKTTIKMIGIVIICCLISNTSNAQESLANRTLSIQEALAKAELYFGLGKVEGYLNANNINAELIKVNDDRTPYLRNWINDKKVWRVIYKDVPYYKTLSLFPYEKEKYLTFDIYIDSETGKLLKIWSRIKDTAAVIRRAENIEDYERKLFRNFGGIPNTDPYPFCEILRRVGVDITIPIEFEAVYILQSINDSLNAPYWHIILHDFQKAKSSPPYLAKSECQKGPSGVVSYTCDYTFDGISGELLRTECGGKPIKRD